MSVTDADASKQTNEITTATPLLDAIGPIPFPKMQSMLDDAFPDGNQNYWKSTFLREFSDEAIANNDGAMAIVRIPRPKLFAS